MTCCPIMVVKVLRSSCRCVSRPDINAKGGRNSIFAAGGKPKVYDQYQSSDRTKLCLQQLCSVDHVETFCRTCELLEVCSYGDGMLSNKSL